MKQISLFTLLLLAFAVKGFAWTVPTQEVKDSISANTHWTADKHYLLKGYVYVTSGATLTIDSGVIIRGDKNTKGALVVERGAKIYANGTKTSPILFTSNEEAGNRSYGDWGGLIMCGYAPTNWTAGENTVEGGPRSKYGGTDPHDNSGKLSYVRIEFAGIPFSPNNEVNGLSLYAIGDATQIDHVQVSYSGDDAIEWFGGSVNSKYIVSYATWDDDFDTDCGFVGKNQFCVVLRDPNSADVSGSKAFESDAYQSGTASGLGGDTSKITKPVFSNCTIMGPVGSNPSNLAYSTNYVAGVHIRRGSGLSLLNSVVAGWPCGVLLDESSASYGSTSANIASGLLQFRANIVEGIPTNGTPSRKEFMYVKDGARSLTPTTAYADTTTGSPFSPFAGPYTFMNNPAFGNFTYVSDAIGTKLWSPWNMANPKFIPTSVSPICYNNKSLPAYVNTYYGGVDTFHNGKKYPFDPTKPINTDTSNFFKNYNAPDVVPDFTTSKANDAFFDKVNYVGAFAGTQSTSDNWMAGWTNFDPVNANYDFVNTGIANEQGKLVSFNTARVFPNPTSGTATLAIELNRSTELTIAIYDMSGRMVQQVFNGQKTAGTEIFNIDLNNVNAGLYFVNVHANDMQKTVKLSVIK